MRRESFLLAPPRAPLLARSILVYNTHTLAQAEQRRIELDSPPPIRVRAHRLIRSFPAFRERRLLLPHCTFSDLWNVALVLSFYPSIFA